MAQAEHMAEAAQVRPAAAAAAVTVRAVLQARQRKALHQSIGESDHRPHTDNMDICRNAPEDIVGTSLDIPSNTHIVCAVRDAFGDRLTGSCHGGLDEHPIEVVPDTLEVIIHCKHNEAAAVVCYAKLAKP
jgi:hypothetical protein